MVFSGWYVWHSQKAADKTFNETNNSQPAALNKRASTTTKSHSASDATQMVRLAYQHYVDAEKSSMDHSALAGLPAMKPYLSDALYVKFSGENGLGYDPVTCAQEDPPSVTTSLGTSTDTTASVKVDLGFSGVNPVQVMVNLQTLKMTAITCPAQPN